MGNKNSHGSSLGWTEMARFDFQAGTVYPAGSCRAAASSTTSTKSAGQADGPTMGPVKHADFGPCSSGFSHEQITKVSPRLC